MNNDRQIITFVNELKQSVQPLNYKRIYFVLENMFDIYSNCLFKEQLKANYQGWDSQLFNDELDQQFKRMYEIINLVCQQLSQEHQKVINLIFVKKQTYLNSFYSKSTYYEKKKRAAIAFLKVFLSLFDSQFLLKQLKW